MNLILKIMSVRLVIAFDKWCLIVERMFFTKGKAGDARMEMIGRVILGSSQKTVEPWRTIA
ncbi:hypothetical protein [Burkholderia pseudomallei]|uniref:hypothetical protein n=1 Tax=Burkholderia pseudomallei TaxID=28450 RepID=UPI002181ED41|nr:hypothetical protein [Burkholderia pseudomallei]